MSGGWFRSVQGNGDVSRTPPADGQFLRYNALTLKWELIDLPNFDDKYLKLDQDPLLPGNPQSVIKGAPNFNGGIVIKAGQKLVLDG